MAKKRKLNSKNPKYGNVKKEKCALEDEVPHVTSLLKDKGTKVE